jgi:hypothetical protein
MAQFSDLVTVVRSLSDRANHAGVVTGTVSVDTPEKLTALQSCEADPDNTALTLVGPLTIAGVGIGSTIQVEIKVPRPGFGLLCENLDALLCYPSAHIKEPVNFYLLDTDFAKDDPAAPGHLVAAYRATLAFVAMLKSCAAFLDEQEELLVFVKEGKFEVPVKFTEKDLRGTNPAELADLSNVIPKGIHEKQCTSIMAEAVYEMTAQLGAEKRFATLLANAKDLKERFDKGYKLFAAGFSYEKIRDEIEGARIEYSGKIHKVFSDIQNQLLGIPVATIIVATQMKENTKIDGNFWVSTAVLIGSFVFMLLMHFLLRNQRDTLDVIGIEIKRQEAKLKNEHAAIAPNFTDTFAALDKRYKAQRTVLYVIDVIVAIGFLLSVFFFYKLSVPVQQWVAHVYCVADSW